MLSTGARTVRAFLKALMVASALGVAFAQVPPDPARVAADPAKAPPDLAKLVAKRATETRAAREQYTYQQSVLVEEINAKGVTVGRYQEKREVIFSPESGRTEHLIGKPISTLQRMGLTPEDFADVQQIQPFLFGAEQLWSYKTEFKGEEKMDGVDCWVLEVRPRQVLEGQRLFDGMIWVDKKDYSIVRTYGKAVPDLRSYSGTENLFPRFTTLWEPVEGGFRFPVLTRGDDQLAFRQGAQRIRLTIRYSDYKRFGAESSIKFGSEAAPPAPPK